MNKTKLTSVALLLTMLSATILLAQGAPTDSTAGLLIQFMDGNGDGVNDNFSTGNAPLQYKYEFGLGYGYGYADNDSDGINDILLQTPDAAERNPLVDSTRIQGLERIKRADFRHGEISSNASILDRTKTHAIHDGHCKSDSLFNVLKNRIQ